MADSIERCVRDMREAARVEGPTGMRDTLLTVAGRIEAVSAAASTHSGTGRQGDDMSNPDQPKCTAADGVTEVFNFPGHPLMVRAVDFNALLSRVAPTEAAAMAATVPALNPEVLTDLIAEHLRGTYHCTRVWHAWGCGTMGEGDFEPVDESDTPTELADAIINKLAAQPLTGAPARTKAINTIVDCIEATWGVRNGTAMCADDIYEALEEIGALTAPSTPTPPEVAP